MFDLLLGIFRLSFSLGMGVLLFIIIATSLDKIVSVVAQVMVLLIGTFLNIFRG